MAKLKLDLFSDVTPSAPSASPRRESIPSEIRPLEGTPGQATAQEENTFVSARMATFSVEGRKRTSNSSPRFIPVGFYREDLGILEGAVFRLRQSGHRQASKSAVIRSLILLHKDELDQVWLAEKERARTR